MSPTAEPSISEADIAELYELHEGLVGIPSLSGEEDAIGAWVSERLAAGGVQVERLGRNVLARAGAGVPLLYCSHLDTVPASKAWTREACALTVEASAEGERRYGLGSNDAKASVAAMMQLALATARRGGPGEIHLALVAEEETSNRGAAESWAHLQGQGLTPQGIVIGEPTNLDLAVSQRGLLILELIAEGAGAHAANARALGVTNPIRTLAADLQALDGVELGPQDEQLGLTTLEPTTLAGAVRRNVVPSRASAYLDIRTVPALPTEVLIERVRERVKSAVRVHSDRLRSVACPHDAAWLRHARAARPQARVYGSRTMSDMVHFADWPVLKVGPGRTERSHTPDEYVLSSELVEGLRFYTALAARSAAGEPAA